MFDIQLNAEDDLSTEEGQSRAMAGGDKIDAWCMAIDCRSLSRARAIKRRGAEASRELRDEKHPWGIPNLSEEERKMVEEANRGVKFTGTVMKKGGEAGAAAILENPRGSWLWDLETKVEGFEDYDFASCAWDGDRAKKERVRSNVTEMEYIVAECVHMHEASEWDPVEGRNGRLHFVHRSEAEFTAKLAFALASALSLWAVRVGRAKLRLLPCPTPASVGDKRTAGASGAERTRLHAMGRVAQELGLPAAPEHQSSMQLVEERCRADWGTTSPTKLIEIKQWWPQEHIDKVFRKMFPKEWTDGLKFPFIEDLVNAGCFVAWIEWLDRRGIEVREQKPPKHMKAADRGLYEAFMGAQAGAMTSKKAVKAMISAEITKDQHYAEAIRKASLSELPDLEAIDFNEDLSFAAAETVRSRKDLRSRRQRDARALSELASRMRQADQHLKKFQPPEIAGVAGKVAVAFIAVVCIIIRWPDWRLPRRFIEGFQAIGRLERTGVMPSREPAECKTRQALFDAQGEVKAALSAKIGNEAEFLWEASLQEVEKGWAAQPVREAVLDKKFGKGKWAACPRFCIEQSSGKKRQIDDADRGQQNEHSEQDESIVLCTAIQPGAAVRMLAKAADEAGVDLEAEGAVVESGGEDMPDAYKICPVRKDDHEVNVVAVQHPSTGEWWFMIAFALLFGYSNAVYSFGRLSRFLEAAVIRLLATLFAMFYDDGSIQDLEQAKGAGQRAIGTFFDLCGMGLKEDKRQAMSSTATFLGLTHRVDEAFKPGGGSVEFWPREGLCEKVLAMIEERRETNMTTPAQASKLCGTTAFTATGMFSGVGKAAAGPLIQRQHYDSQPWTNSDALKSAFDYLEVIFKAEPRRELKVRRRQRPLILLATDAQAEPGSRPSGGYLAIDTITGEKRAAYIEFDDETLDAWNFGSERRAEGANPIAVCEAAMPLVFLLDNPRWMIGRGMLAFIDNSVALFGLVKGQCRGAAVARAVQLVNMLCYHLDLDKWWEFIPSVQNWSDGVSREGANDPWAAENGFVVATTTIRAEWWTMPLQHAWAHTRDIVRQ